MNTEQYNIECLRSALSDEETQEIYIRRLKESVHNAQLLHGLIGICTEAGELQDNIKRFLMYGKPFDVDNLVEESGDLLWYINIALRSQGKTLEDAMKHNVAKLRLRYPEKFTEKDALERKDKYINCPVCGFINSSEREVCSECDIHLPK